ncbi:hypothetical protein BC828DRAFT_379952 [Blastocladiella britannica]|nr:hypothetical protein BC828DRAFT_379952 [Blastocladiella britannica]
MADSALSYTSTQSTKSTSSSQCSTSYSNTIHNNNNNNTTSATTASNSAQVRVPLLRPTPTATTARSSTTTTTTLFARSPSPDIGLAPGTLPSPRSPTLLLHHQMPPPPDTSAVDAIEVPIKAMSPPPPATPSSASAPPPVSATTTPRKGHRKRGSILSLSRGSGGIASSLSHLLGRPTSTPAGGGDPDVSLAPVTTTPTLVDPSTAGLALQRHLPTPVAFNAARVNKVLRDKTHLFLSTQRTQYRTRWATFRTPRFLLRMVQLVVSAVTVATLYEATFNVNYTSTAISLSGINLASLTTVTSVVLSMTHVYALMFPKSVGIAPQDERTYSPVEIVMDSLYCGLFLLSSSLQAAVGTCPRYLIRIGNTPESAAFSKLTAAQQAELLGVGCLPWNLSWCFGYLTAILYGVTAWLGLKAWRKQRQARELLFL